ncbi:MAG: hypothetical protein WBM57_04300 [Woeseiaceae bacterium]|jgi:hypothetical protein
MKALINRKNIVAGSIALGGMIVGAVVGIAVQAAVDSTGILGPSVEELLEEQEANFGDINARLAELKDAASDPAVKRSLVDLEKLLARQGELQSQANSELAWLGDQVSSLRQASLEERGFSGGADMWLSSGESVAVGDRSNVLGVTKIWGETVDVNLNGEKSRMKVGDAVSTEACTVFFKQRRRDVDGRVGFDVSCG